VNRKQQVFVVEYLKCWNASEAARRAGYKNANVQGARLLAIDSIAAEIRARIEEKSMSADEVITRLATQARSDIGEFLTVDGEDWALNLQAIKERGYLVKKIKQGPHGPEIELHDAQAALALLGKTLGLFVDRQELSGGVQLTVVYSNPPEVDPNDLV